MNTPKESFALLPLKTPPAPGTVVVATLAALNAVEAEGGIPFLLSLCTYLESYCELCYEDRDYTDENAHDAGCGEANVERDFFDTDAERALELPAESEPSSVYPEEGQRIVARFPRTADSDYVLFSEGDRAVIHLLLSEEEAD